MNDELYLFNIPMKRIPKQSIKKALFFYTYFPPFRSALEKNSLFHSLCFLAYSRDLSNKEGGGDTHTHPLATPTSTHSVASHT